MEPFANTGLAPSSRALFTKKLLQFASFMPAEKQTIDFLIDNPELAVKALKAQPTIKQTEANLHMFFSAAVAYLKHTDAGKKRSEPLKQRWEQIQKGNWETRRQQSLNNEPTTAQTEVATQLKWADVIKKRDELPHGDAKLLLSMYTYLPPVRADYYEVKINPNPVPAAMTKANFILLGQNTGEIVLRDFKTAAKYKEIKHVLPQPLFNEIKAAVQSTARPYLFVMPTDPTRPYDRGAFSKWANKTLKATFGLPMTLTTLRHLYVSTLDFNKTKASDLEKIGNSMGHSIAMQKGYQWL